LELVVGAVAAIADAALPSPSVNTMAAVTSRVRGRAYVVNIGQLLS
jgi:hypothetical protein